MRSLGISVAVLGCCATLACSSGSSGTPGTGATTSGTVTGTSGTATTGTTSGSGSTTSGGLSAQTACSDYASAVCSLISTCSQGFLIARDYTNYTACTTAVASDCVTALSAPQTASTPTTVETCAHSTTNESCADYFDNNAPAGCIPPKGPVASGATCLVNGQCATGFCAVPTGTVCGSCAAVPAVGDSCANIGCGNQGLICSTETQTCLVPVADGGTCIDPSQCVAGFDCLGLDAGGAPGLCQPKGTRAGDTCDGKHFDATACYSRLGLFCSEKVCRKTQIADAGAPCGEIDAGPLACAGSATTCIVDEQIVCGAGAVCVETNATTATCVAPAAAGDDCDVAAGPLCAAGDGSCVLTSDAGTSGICAQATAAACE